jgi:4-hydroxyacetophenone monooxygenase
VQSWYKNKQGRVFAISPWRLVEYWRMTSKFDAADYVFG